MLRSKVTSETLKMSTLTRLRPRDTIQREVISDNYNVHQKSGVIANATTLLNLGPDRLQQHGMQQN